MDYRTVLARRVSFYRKAAQQAKQEGRYYAEMEYEGFLRGVAAAQGLWTADDIDAFEELVKETDQLSMVSFAKHIAKGWKE
jgi:hypothetical protein